MNIDERNLSTIQKVCTIMYYLNILILAAILIYREFVLHQSVKEFMDIANLLVFNAIVAISAILYLGGITFRKIRFRTMVTIYILFVTVGFIFTLFQYHILKKQPLTLNFALEKLFIILIICALFLIVYGLFAYLGHKKIEKNI